MLLRHFERIGLAGDTNSKKCPVVDSGLDAGDGSITPRVGENPRADRHPVDVDNAGVRRNRCPRWQADPARDAGLLADRGLGRLGIDPDDFRAGALGRTKSDAFEMAALGLTPVFEHDGDAHANSMRRGLFKRMTEDARIEDAQNLYPSPSINPA